MRTYTVTVQWYECTRGDYHRRSKTFRGIKAKDILEAGKIALDRVGDKISVSISTIWYDV